MKLIKVLTISLLLTSTVLGSEFIDNSVPHHFPIHLIIPYVMTKDESRDLHLALADGSLMGVKNSIGVAQQVMMSNTRDQILINYALRCYAYAGYLEALVWFISDACPHRLDHNSMKEAVNSAFYTAVCSRVPMVEWFFSDTCPIKPEQYTVNRAFGYATNHNWPMAEWLCSDACPIKPDQSGVNNAFLEAASRNSLLKAEWFFSSACPVKPDQEGVNDALACSLINLPMVEWFFSSACPGKPDQEGVNNAFAYAAGNNYLPMMGWFFSSACPVKPDQEGVNDAFHTGARRNGLSVMQWFFSESCPIRPDVDTLCSVYRNLQHRHGNNPPVQVLRHLILNHLPQRYRQVLLADHAQGNAGGQSRGIAFEIHDYANIVFDEAMTHVSTHLPNESLPTIQEVQALLLQKGSDLFISEDQSKVVEAILIALSPEYMETLSKVLHFVQSHHGDKIDLWMHSFIGDSITAYNNSIRTLSCSKGVKERILTGLRTLANEDLNTIFAPAEGPLLTAKKFALFNLKDESMKAARVRDLKALGATADTSLDEFALRIREMVTHTFEGDTLSEAETITIEETIRELIDKMGSDRSLFHT